MSLPNPKSQIGEFNGAVNGVVYACSDLATQCSTVQSVYEAAVATVAGYAQTLIEAGLPQGGYTLANEGVVSVLRSPLNPVVLEVDPVATTVSVCQAVLPLLETLLPSNDPLLVLVTSYGDGEPLTLQPNPYPHA